MPKVCRNAIAFFVLFLPTLASVHLAAQTSGPVQYVYDELGRLTAAIDANGNTAVYTYDAVGNILSIARYTSSQAGVFSFTPKFGPVGTNVTIYGSGFSSTASQDSVSFNGTSASILSASTTQLLVAVPTGATTGPLTITSPAGSVTTSNPFTVTSSNGKARIDSFSPQAVNVGNTVTINGANFDPTLANDRLMVNATTGLNPATASPASLTLTTPPLTASGRLSLSTPTGTVTAASDLFIPPTANYTQYTVAALNFAGRTNPGSAATVTIGTANQYGLLLFDGNAGQMVSAVANSGGTFSSCTMSVLNTQNFFIPDSRNPGQSAIGSCTTNGGFMDSQVLPATGTYAMLVNPGSSTGHSTITPYVFSDVEATLTVGGSPYTLTTTVPGQNGRFTFLGTIGQHVSITSSGSNFSTCTVEPYDPYGVGLQVDSACQSGTTFGDLGILNYHQNYTLVFDPSGAATGTVTFQLNDATDVTGSITPAGSPVTATTTVPGQNIRLTFSGTTGQIVSGFFDNSTFQGDVTFSVISPSGTTLYTGSTTQSHGDGLLDPTTYGTYNSYVYPTGVHTLPANGTYTLLIDPSGADVGTIRATLYNVTDPVISGTMNGSTNAVSVATPGEYVQITFAGTLNHKLGINLTGGTLSGAFSPGCTLYLLQPNGSFWIGGYNCYVASSFLELYPLPTTGTWTLLMRLTGNTTGNTNVQLYDDTDINMNISANGSSNIVTTTVPGQNAYLNFSGTSNQRLFAVVNNISGFTNLTTSEFQLTEGIPSHSAVAYSTQDGSTYDICGSSCGVESLPANDSYSIFIKPNGTDTGSATVTVYTVPADFSSTIDTAGDPVTVTTTTPGQNAVLTLSANSGQSLSLSLTSGTYPSSHCLLSIKNPGGATVASGLDCSGASHSFGPYSLSSTGTYTITIDPQYAATGSVVVSATAH